MIHVSVLMDENSIVRRVRADGHSGFSPKGTDIVCAAVSVLLRTFAHSIETREDILVRGVAEKRGELTIEVVSYPAECASWLGGVSRFLTQGLNDVCEEYPDRCVVEIQ